MGKVLEESLSNFSDRISDAVKTKKNILVTTHIDCCLLYTSPSPRD